MILYFILFVLIALVIGVAVWYGFGNMKNSKKGFDLSGVNLSGLAFMGGRADGRTTRPHAKAQMPPLYDNRANLTPSGTLEIPKSTITLTDDDLKKIAADLPKTFEPLTAKSPEIADLAKKYKLPARVILGIRNFMNQAKMPEFIKTVKDSPLTTSSKPSLEVAKELHVPPSAVVKQRLLNEGKLWDEVQNILKNPTEDIIDALRADHLSSLNMEPFYEESKKFQDTVAKKLKAAGIKDYLSADELRAEQTADGKKPVATPDFFFKTPITVSPQNEVVHWIVLKDYPLLNSKVLIGAPDEQSMQIKRMASLAKKYNKHFGPGAFIFSGGLVKDTTIPDCEVLVLDGSGF